MQTALMAVPNLELAQVKPRLLRPLTAGGKTILEQLSTKSTALPMMNNH
jgi:hypothetical protein